MEGFVKVNNTLVNVVRLLAVEFQPAREAISSNEIHKEGSYYLVIFDTGKQLRLSGEDGALLLEQFQNLGRTSSAGTIATTSESAM